MPALIFLKRKWLIACDDFVIPSGIEGFLRLIWLISTLTLIWLKINNCAESRYINSFLYAAAGDLLFTFGLSLAIAILSGRGSVLEVKKRQYLSKLLYVKVFTIFCDITIASYGVWLFTHMDKTCIAKEIFIEVTSIAAFLFLLCVIIGIFVCYDSLGSSRFWDVEANSFNSLNFFKRAQYIWRARLKLFCCCADISEEHNLIYVEMSTFLSSFLNGIDLVPTDILAGIVSVSQKHALEKRKNMLVHLPDSIGLLENSQVPDWMTPENAMYFLKIAKSTYGWLVFFDTFHPWNLCILSSHSRCCTSCCTQNSERKLDNCCYLNTAAVQKMMGFSDSDILYASFSNSIHEPAFYVAVDHKRNYVIIAIRGTRSFSDLMTDLDAEHLYFPSEREHKFKCHRGALRSALFLQKKLSEQNLLEAAFAENPSYNLAMTGHSLGGSVAAILALLLLPKYPNLQCYAYGPLAVLSALGLQETMDSVLSVVVGVDMSPRLCTNSCIELRKQIIASLGENKSPKFQILAEACWYHVQRYFKIESQRNVAEVYENTLCENEDENMSAEDNSLIFEESKLYAPGRILYFERKNCYKPFWLTGLNLQKIIVHPDMIADHQPHRIQHMLEMYMKTLDDESEDMIHL